jgi:predicted nucleic acid-binding protein
MGSKRKMTVSNSGPLIHLAKIDKLILLKELFGEVIIPLQVKTEVVDAGKEEGMADAFLIEGEIENGWIIIEGNITDFEEIARNVGIDEGEAAAIVLARKMKKPILLDDLGARRFAIGLGLEVIGSIGVLFKCTKLKIISNREALDCLEKLARIMWLSVDVYEDARKTIEEM